MKKVENAWKDAWNNITSIEEIYRNYGVRSAMQCFHLVKYRDHIQILLTQAKVLEKRARRREEEAFRARKSQRRSTLEQRANKLSIRAKALREEAAQTLKTLKSFETLRQHNSDIYIGSW